jgi:two-component system, NarL family, nitrate/nitrite response regulator NarL
MWNAQGSSSVIAEEHHAKEERMPLQAVRERPKTGQPEVFVSLSPEEMLKQLIAYISTDAEARTAKRRMPEQSDEVLFEAEIDGTNYYVICNRPLPPTVPVSLSPRELAIARLIAKGLPNKSISDILEISPYTVATHLRRIFIKLGVSSRAAMVARLLEENLLTM